MFLILMAAVCTSFAGAIVQDPTQFSQAQHWNGIGACVKMQIASTGEVFCADKTGAIRMYPSLAAGPGSYSVVWTAAADLTADWNDRGLLGLVLDPKYPTNPYIWILMSVRRLDSVTDTTVRPNTCSSDANCIDGTCDMAARLMRIVMNNGIGTTDQVLMSGWCSNGESHHIGNLAWARDGGLFVSGGDGASYTVPDRGTIGAPCHRDGDARSQGAWRSQWDDYTHGKILYISKDRLMGNTPITIGDGAKIVAKGLRNPFRFAIHPVTFDLYVGDVGSDFYEEINLVPDPLTATTVPNFGWPCYEGVPIQPTYGADPGCVNVPAITPWVYYSRRTGFKIPSAQANCMRNTVSPGAFTFKTDNSWGSKWQNRLIWADSSMQCMFVFANDANGLPNNDTTQMTLISYNTPTGTDNKWVDMHFVDGDNNSLYVIDYDQSQLVAFTYLGDRTIDSSIPQPSTNPGGGGVVKTTTSTKSSAAVVFSTWLAATVVILIAAIIV